jgi:16S rRNA (guanine966-N2)-methyltransferase
VTQGQVRIIGGQWRGRKLLVPNSPNLRPTPDRVRETLFNWLNPYIIDAHCLDAFAGSGALGFEALSRGAAKVTMVDSQSNIITLLREQQAIFKATNLSIYQAALPQGLIAPEVKFNVVFLDPPYQSDLLTTSCDFLEKNNFLADNAYIYLESDKLLTDAQLPANWQIIKSKQAGQVAYHLALRHNNSN